MFTAYDDLSTAPNDLTNVMILKLKSYLDRTFKFNYVFSEYKDVLYALYNYTCINSYDIKVILINLSLLQFDKIMATGGRGSSYSSKVNSI